MANSSAMSRYISVLRFDIHYYHNKRLIQKPRDGIAEPCDLLNLDQFIPQEDTI